VISRGWVIVGLALVLAVGVAAFASYGLRGAGGSPAQQMRAWVAQYNLGSSIGTLTGDNASVAKVVAQHGGLLDFHTVCGVLTTDAESANGNLPSPDSDVTQWLAHAYDLEYQAGIDCYFGPGYPGKQAQSATSRSQAQVLFDRALTRIRAISGLVVPTTTTTSAGGGLFG
jgi:hypothetical protein